MVSASTAGQYLQDIHWTAGPHPASGEHVHGDPRRCDGLVAERSRTARMSEPDSRRGVATQCRTVWHVAGFGMPAGRRRRHGGRHRGRECIAGPWRVTPGPGGDAGLAGGEGTEPHPGWPRQAGRAAGLTRLRRAVPGQSHRASSVRRHEEGNGVEGTPDRLGLSSGPEGSLPAWLIGRTYLRRENTPEILESNPLQESIRAWTEFCERQPSRRKEEKLES
jgi:hypothetical protein